MRSSALSAQDRSIARSGNVAAERRDHLSQATTCSPAPFDYLAGGFDMNRDTIRTIAYWNALPMCVKVFTTMPPFELSTSPMPENVPVTLGSVVLPSEIVTV